ncbi:MAG: hypothetical protein DME56_13330 [Verrucomicrobia bacterium]|nr:MAG: hypothetical protein DMF00_09295 [Verrucomicrobiota bacterium]PYK18486.1 MAG: hypothetical protein DME56_13330 [Verrucomicrobiota bacterium]
MTCCTSSLQIRKATESVRSKAVRRFTAFPWSSVPNFGLRIRFSRGCRVRARPGTLFDDRKATVCSVAVTRNEKGLHI